MLQNIHFPPFLVIFLKKMQNVMFKCPLFQTNNNTVAFFIWLHFLLLLDTYIPDLIFIHIIGYSVQDPKFVLLPQNLDFF